MPDIIESTLVSAANRMPAGGWTNPPLEREGGYRSVWKRVARTSQLFMREHFAATYFSDRTRYGNTRMAWPVLLFAASKPYFSTETYAFTYDLLDDEAVAKFYRSAARGLPALLEKVEAELSAAGMTELAKQYAPWRTPDIVAFVERDRNPMYTLLHSEAMLLDDLLRLGRRMRGIAAQPRTLPTAEAVAAEFSRGLHTRLRRFYRKAPVEELAVPLFLAVTKVLNEGLGVVE